jgi:hypothetical protein
MTNEESIMANDNPTLSQVPEGVNGYVVEAAISRIELVMAALYHHCHEHRENTATIEEAVKALAEVQERLRKGETGIW